MNVRPKIVVVGSSNTDLVVRLPRLPKPGETVTSSQFFKALGGKGANQAVAAARLGAEVTFVCKLGRDEYGQGCYQAYQAEGIHLEHVAWDPETPSGVCLIFVDQQGENQIGFAPGANMHMTAADVTQAETAIAAADCLLIELEIPEEADLQAARTARQHGVPVILNPAPTTPFSAELLEWVNVLTPNETELAFVLNLFAGAAGSARQGLAWLTGHVPYLVITLGAQGCRLLFEQQDVSLPAFPVKSVDSTGAGDAFNGGLAVALARGLQLGEAARFASAVAALSVTRLGAMASLPTAAEVETFLSEHP
jgi:ribokinase